MARFITISILQVSELATKVTRLASLKMVSAQEQSETPPKPLSTVPFPRDTDFINREALFHQISEKCSAPASRVALCGLGGVG